MTSDKEEPMTDKLHQPTTSDKEEEKPKQGRGLKRSRSVGSALAESAG